MKRFRIHAIYYASRAWRVISWPWQILRTLEKIEQHLSALSGCIGDKHPHINLPDSAISVKVVPNSRD